jgi:hypothetical protein
MPVKSGAKGGKKAKAAPPPPVKAELKEDPEGESEEEEEEEEESEDEDAPPTKKGKRKADGSAANARAAARNMAFDKGTYIFRLSDLNLDPVKDCVWRVDNHQLLQRYNPESDEKVGGQNRKYVRTQNYTGWMCAEGWDYIKLEVTGMFRNMGREENVTVKYPTDDAIEKAKALQAKKQSENGNN